MQRAAHAYARTAQVTQSPRELEASVLMRAATRLQSIRDDWEGRHADLTDALAYNRKVWTVLVSAVAEAGNPLPDGLKQSMASLGVFVFNRSLSLQIEPRPEGVSALVNINREIAAGLRGQALAA